MKSVNFFFLLGCCLHLLPGHTQTILDKSVFSLRSNDRVVKHELEYKSPGRDGKSVVWDFSELSSLNTESAEYFYGKIDSSLICLGWDGGYKYRLTGDSLFRIGFQNSISYIDYLLPELNRIYPMCYSDSICSLYYGEGMYSHTLPMVTFGETNVKIDAEGMLLLPDNIRMDHVLRVKETKHSGQRLSSSLSILCNGDSSRYSADSLRYHLQHDRITRKTIIYKWYAPGYRYPVFETVHDNIDRSGNVSPRFQRSYYFPPQQHSDLPDDPENENIRMEIQAQEEKRQREQPHWNNAYPLDKGECAYNYFVDTNGNLQIEYYLNEPCTIEVCLNNVAGYNIWRQAPSQQESGMYTVACDMSALPPGMYLLSLITKNKVYTEKIQKL